MSLERIADIINLIPFGFELLASDTIDPKEDEDFIKDFIDLQSVNFNLSEYKETEVV